MFSIKKQIIRDSIIVAGVFLVVLTGCDRVARHKVLSFFFEGVPPLDSERQAVDTGATDEESPTTETEVAVTSEKPARIAKQTDPSRHEPAKDCDQCHRRIGSWSRKTLTRPLPEVCYTCHTDYSAAGGYLHGPIAAGACAFCHDPHGAKYVHLQKELQPKLCYQCHLREDIASIADHQDKQHSICTECHDPHMGSRRDFLKLEPESKDDSNPVDLSE